MYMGELELRRADIYGQKPYAVDMRVGAYGERSITAGKVGTFEVDTGGEFGASGRVLHRKPLIDTTTGLVYKSIAYAGRALNWRYQRVLDNTGPGSRFNFVSDDTPITGGGHLMKRVKEISTGHIYDSPIAVAEAFGLTKAWVYKLIASKKRFKYV